MISVADMKESDWYNQFLAEIGKNPNNVDDNELKSLTELFEKYVAGKQELINNGSDPHIATLKNEVASLSAGVATRFCDISTLDMPKCPNGVDESLYDLACSSAIRSLSLSGDVVDAANLAKHIQDNLSRIISNQAAALIAQHEKIAENPNDLKLDELANIYEKIAGANSLEEALKKYYGDTNPEVQAILNDPDVVTKVNAIITLDEANRNEAWATKLVEKNPNAKSTLKDKNGKEVSIDSAFEKFKVQLDKIKNNRYMKAAAKMGLGLGASAVGLGKLYRVINGGNYIAQQAKEKGVTVADLLSNQQSRKELLQSPTVISMFPGGRYINAANRIKKMFSTENKNTFKNAWKAAKLTFTAKDKEERIEALKDLGKYGGKAALITLGGAAAVFGAVMAADHLFGDDDISMAEDESHSNDTPAGKWQEDTKQFWKHPTEEKEELPKGWSVRGEYTEDDSGSDTGTEGSENQELTPEEKEFQADLARLPGQLNPNILTPGGLAALKGSMSPEEYKLSLAMLYPKEGCDQLGIEFKNSSQLMNMYNNGELSEEQKVALMRYAESRWNENGNPLTEDGNIDTASQEQWRAEEAARNEAKLAAEKAAASRAMGSVPKVDSSKIDDLAAQQDKSGLNIKASQNYTPAEDVKTPVVEGEKGDEVPTTPVDKEKVDSDESKEKDGDKTKEEKTTEVGDRGSVAKGAVAKTEIKTDENGIIQRFSVKDKIREMRGLGNSENGSGIKETTLSKELIESRISTLRK